MIKTCVICGAAFKASPSDKTVTCSAACRSIRAAQAARETHRTWNADSKARRAQNPAVLAQMERIQTVGVAAALSLPEGQRGEQNRESKRWELIDPAGQRVLVTNLLHWARNNYQLFEPDSLDPEESAMRITSGFRAIASSMRGVKSRTRPVMTYKGWSLASLPEKPDKETDL